jgi:hypothetical protein
VHVCVGLVGDSFLLQATADATASNAIARLSFMTEWLCQFDARASAGSSQLICVRI